MRDIETRSDIDIVIRTFYGKVVQDDLIGPFFKHFDLDTHIPKMVDFWDFALLDMPGYTTDVTKMHMHMRLKQEHFDRWIEIFKSTIDELHQGDIVEKAKQRAVLIGWTIKSKMG
ncbi:MAG: group III truncated hemoglobin [Crocinitomicaceae bacterium]|nr:group III truncated hemoglobin [Crocinitomicaceae bacterium]